MKQTTIFALFLTLAFPLTAHSEPCQLTWVTRSEILQIKETNQDLRSISAGLNEALKASYEVMNHIDHATFGLASAFLTGGAASLENMKPVEWDKARFVGHLVYQDGPLSVTPLKGTSVQLKHYKKSWDLTTGTGGEFALPLYELVSYKRIRLFPTLIIERGQRYKKAIDSSVTVSVSSPLCTSELKFSEIPLEPILLIANRTEK